MTSSTWTRPSTPTATTPPRIPRSGGGTDHLENLQLLCAHCNRVKGDRPQE
ncbi:MAG: HNH endonuclease [Dehalococcoidia bacterium]|nr:HNH endonuclease [Dehalococcoidia bacterium]